MRLQQRIASLLLLAGAAATLLLAGCGFQLRGSTPGSILPFRTVHLGVAENSPLGIELKRYLRSSGDITVVSEAKQAEASVEILSEARQKQILTLNTQGRIREYSLIYRLTFQVKDGKGAVLLEPTEIVLKRDLSFNEAQAIAKEKEEEMLYRDMQGDLVQQILRRMAALRPAA